VAPRYFYAFVDLEPDVPVTYIVPSEIVAEVISRAHKKWLETPGQGGKPHKDHPMRRLLPAYGFEVPGYAPGWLDQFRERWDLITATVGRD
jgi:hypothetical protein